MKVEIRNGSRSGLSVSKRTKLYKKFETVKLVIQNRLNLTIQRIIKLKPNGSKQTFINHHFTVFSYLKTNYWRLYDVHHFQLLKEWLFLLKLNPKRKDFKVHIYKVKSYILLYSKTIHHIPLKLWPETKLLNPPNHTKFTNFKLNWTN